MHVIGTAGHVDHGKSTLVEALTGTHPDRLREEQERQMSIVLGFAWLTLPGGEQVGIVDVPGHKDFIKNMLAGVGGIDAALLVIAADEGVMPQTREHLAILDLLQLRSGLIVLTKTDLVDDPEWLELVTADVMDQVAGTCMENAPIVPVSARTGDGLDVLVAELEKLLKNVPPRADLGRPRLPVDRVFTISGFGTIVTGTLIDGTLRTGQEVEILPSMRKARVRGLQTHKAQIEQALPGSRVAINLGGVRVDEVQVGEVVTLPGWLKPTSLVDVQLRYLADVPWSLKHDAQVDLYCGAAEVPAHVRLLGTQKLDPGETGWAQLRLSRPIALVRDDRFIMRWPSPSTTIGGGSVVDPNPRRRHRRFRPEVTAALETLAQGTPEEILMQTLAHEQPCEARALIERLALPADVASEALNGLLAAGKVLLLGGDFVVLDSGWQRLVEQMLAILKAYHNAYPLRKGMPREELRSRLQEQMPNGDALHRTLFNQAIARATQEGAVGQDETSVWSAGHTVRLTPEHQLKVDALLKTFHHAPYTTPSVAECEASLGGELLNALIESGQLIRLSADVIYLGETVSQMKEQVIAHMRRKDEITVAQVRDMFGASRKYALALMEYLDEQRVTRRAGDVRVLRNP